MSEVLALIEAALRILFTPTGLTLLVVGTVFGLVLGAIPGLGPVVGLSIAIPFTFIFDPLQAFILLIAIMGGVNFGGSLSSILLSTPGTVASAASLLDGYPMSRQGRGDEAIAASAVASAAGALVGIFVLALTLPLLVDFVMLFGSPEVFLLAVWGLTLVASVVRGSLVVGLISAGLGLLIAMHGFNPQTTTVRWDYGLTFLRGGFGLIPPVVGLFAIAEMMNLLSKGESIAAGGADDDSNPGSGSGGSSEGDTLQTNGAAVDASVESSRFESSGRLKGMYSIVVHKWLFVRSAVIGVLIGVIPGVGGSAANYVAYFQAVQTSDNPERFGTGDVRGLIASEASNDAKDGGSLMPTLALGIPGSATTAILLGAFVLHGITPGPLVLQERMDLVVMIILALIFSNILTSLLGLTLSNYLMLITKVDIRIIAPVVIAIAFFGTYAASNTIHDVYTAGFFGLLGYMMIRTGISRIPLILGLVLGPVAEAAFWRSWSIGAGDPMIFLRSWVAILLVIGIVLSLLSPIINPLIRKQINRVLG